MLFNIEKQHPIVLSVVFKNVEQLEVQLSVLFGQVGEGNDSFNDKNVPRQL